MATMNKIMVAVLADYHLPKSFLAVLALTTLLKPVHFLSTVAVIQ